MSALRAAIIGARGIGKHHGKWLAYEGCEVVAIVGTSEETNKKTAASLKELFGFSGRAYTSVEEMLRRERPDLISIASPPQMHYDHALAAAAARVHVMCEKPLVWHDDLGPRELMGRAWEVVDRIEGVGLVGAVNTQYVAALEPYYALAARLGVQRQAPRTLFMQMDSRGAHGPVTYEDIWRDLGPHPVSVMMAFCGYGRIDHKSLEVVCAEQEFDARFVYVPETGPPCECHLRACNVPEGPLVRRLGINGHLMDYEGRADEDGVYRAWCTMEGEQLWWDDFMQISFRRFLAAIHGEERPLATLHDGWANLGFQLEILHAAKRI